MNSNNVILVSGCMLCPAFQAVRLEKNMTWSQSILPFLTQKGFNVVAMPCPEVTFGSMAEGMKRRPHGIGYYEKVDGFAEHCRMCGEMVCEQISELLQSGFNVTAVVGIEHSPTCAANYMYTNQGTVKRQGLFMEVIAEGIKQMGWEIPILGINRNYPDKFLRDLEERLKL